MPLGTGNDLGRALGWGFKYPGYTKCPCCQQSFHGKNIRAWIDHAISVSTPYVNFDVWGFMPPPDKDTMNVKVAELARVKKVNGEKQLILRPADPVAPFLVFLYCSYGFIGQVISRFQPQRRSSQLMNKLVMTKATAEIILGFRAKQLRPGMDGFSLSNLPGAPLEKNGTDRYFPPRESRKASAYKDVGFMNVDSFVGGNLRGMDRTTFCNRWFSCGSGRKPVNPTDGKADFFRERLGPTVAKTGNKLLVDKKDGAVARFAPAPGQGIFFQWDGEGRFAFHPDGEEWRMDICRVLTIPMVVAGSFMNKRSTPVGQDVKFSIVGTPEEKIRVKARLMQAVSGALVSELNATAEEIKRAGLILDGDEDPLGKEIHCTI
jgi:hypothetical protein